MNIDQCEVYNLGQRLDSSEDISLVNNLMDKLKRNDFDFDQIKTNEAIAVCKNRLLGEYNSLLVRNMEEYLNDAEVYVITWDGEASDGGEIFRLNTLNLPKIIDGTIFGGTLD